MLKRKIKKLHTKYPFVESIFLFLSGIFIGFFMSLLTDEISEKSSLPNWNMVQSYNFWISLILILLSVIYYWKFSSFSIEKQLDALSKEEETLKLAIMKQAKKGIESDKLSYEKKLILYSKTMQVIRNTDCSNNDSNS